MPVTIASFTFDYSGSGGTCTVRWYADSDFLDPDGVYHPAQAAGGSSFLKSVTCSVASNVATVPTFTLPATWDEASGARSSLTAYVFNSAGQRVGNPLVSNFRIPTLPATTTWGALLTYNDDAASIRDTNTYTKQQTDFQIAQAALSGGPAGTTALGRVKTSAAPSDATSPVAVITDDRDWKNVKGDVFNPKAYGAVCDNATDDTAAWLAAVAALHANGGGRLIVPAGRSVIGGVAVANYILHLTVPCIVEGYGARSVIVPATDTPITTDVFRVTPPPHVGFAEALLNNPEDNAGWVFRNFVIRPASGTPCRDGIRVDITTAGSFFQNSRFEGLFFGDLGGHSVSLINTTALAPGGVNADGCFNNYFYDCDFHGGIFADALGDSNHFYCNRFWSLTDATHRAFDITFIAGAGANEFIGNSITVKLGAGFAGGTGTVFANNYVELFRAASAGAGGACVNFSGGAAGTKIRDNRFVGNLNSNTLNGLNIGLASGTVVDGNEFGADVGQYGINISASATDTTVTAANTVAGGGTLMNDLGSGTGTEVFSSSGGRVTRVGTAFGSVLGATEAFSGFGATTPAVLEINRNVVTSTDANYAAQIFGTNQTGTANLIGAAYFVNNSLGVAEKRVAGYSVSTDGATNSGRFDFATFNAGTRTIKFSITKAGVVVGALGTEVKNVCHGTATLSGGTAAVSFSTLGDANYRVELSGNANETFYWASKTATGFTINSSNAGSTATVDWVLYHY